MRHKEKQCHRWQHQRFLRHILRQTQMYKKIWNLILKNTGMFHLYWPAKLKKGRMSIPVPWSLQARCMPTFLQQYFLTIGTGYTWCRKGSKWFHTVWQLLLIPAIHNLCQHLKIKKMPVLLCTWMCFSAGTNLINMWTLRKESIAGNVGSHRQLLALGD